MSRLDRTTLRVLILSSFAEEEIEELCFDLCPDVFDLFGSGMSKRKKVLTLLKYCYRFDLIEQLVKKVKELRPKQFDDGLQQDVLQSDVAPDPRVVSQQALDDALSELKGLRSAVTQLTHDMTTTAGALNEFREL